jgi:DNA-binding NarL/FixJ family response regulator
MAGRAAAIATAALGESAAAIHRRAGAATPAWEIIAEALTPLPSAGARRDRPNAGGLSRRERDVLRLLAGGASDPEIAAALFISRRTVATHVAHIFAKLGVHSRAAATAVAVRDGIA